MIVVINDEKFERQYKVFRVFRNDEKLLKFIRDIVVFDRGYGGRKSISNLILGDSFGILKPEGLDDDDNHIIHIGFGDNKKQSIGKWLKEKDIELWVLLVKKAAKDVLDGDRDEKLQIETEINDLKNKLEYNENSRWKPAINWYDNVMKNLELKKYDEVYNF